VQRTQNISPVIFLQYYKFVWNHSIIQHKLEVLLKMTGNYRKSSLYFKLFGFLVSYFSFLKAVSTWVMNLNCKKMC
jgi:hypothetical protein